MGDSVGVPKLFNSALDCSSVCDLEINQMSSIVEDASVEEASWRGGTPSICHVASVGSDHYW